MDYSNLPIVERLIKSYPRRSNPDQANIEKMQISLMAALDEKEFRTLETALVKIFDSGTEHQCEMAEEIMTDMLAYSSHNIDQLIVNAIDRQGYLPAPLFRGAGDTVKKKLFALMKHDDNLARKGLAWIGDEEVVNWFAERRTKRQKKSQSSSIDHLYPLDAGWELTADNEKRVLFSLHCHATTPLHWIPLSNQYKQQDDPKLCKLCRSHVVTVKDLKTSNFEELFSLSRPVPSIDVPFCELCSGLNPMRSTILDNGTTELCEPDRQMENIPDWHSDNEGDGGNITLEIGPSRNPFLVADYCNSENCSQIGGHPTWVQDSEYPLCQSCGRTMLFLMQIDGNQLYCIYPFMYYFFICDLCPDQLAVSNQHT